MFIKFCGVFDEILLPKVIDLVSSAGAKIILVSRDRLQTSIAFIIVQKNYPLENTKPDREGIFISPYELHT